jgi:hypothetical protein
LISVPHAGLLCFVAPSTPTLLLLFTTLRHFQELDFDWSMPIEAVLAAVPRIAAIVAEEAARAHGLEGPPPAPIVSMRTPYKARGLPHARA